MSDLESALLALETKIEKSAKAAKALSAALGKLRAATQSGNLIDLDKMLPVVGQRAEDADGLARELAVSWRFDAAAYLSEGKYVEELKAATEAAGLPLFEKDGRIYVFPLLLRIDAGALAIRMGKTLERRIRPSKLASLLAASLKRPQRFTEAQFLNLLYKTYLVTAGAEWRKSERGLGPVIPVADLHEALTLLPDVDYPIEEFGRDLLLLDRKPDLRTRDGSRIELPKSTIGKERVKRVAVYDEHGRERLYIGIRFVREG